MCLKKASTKHNCLIKKAQASCLGTSELLLIVGDLDVVEGTGDLHVTVVAIGDLLLLDASV